MARVRDRYVCQSCGNVTSKWTGKCDACGEWNTIQLEAASKSPPGSMAFSTPSSTPVQDGGNVIDFVSLTGGQAEPRRFKTGIREYDHICGGGLVPGSTLLLGGDPGIGKSTLLLQICARLAEQGLPVAYISGEESINQIRLRAKRMNLEGADLQLACETGLRDILTSLSKSPANHALIVIDSIQTMWSDVISAAPGTVSQVRASAQELIRFAKQSNSALLMVGHVTKDGQLAGPRVLEHMVDTVLYFEGERGDQYRILRAVKNRFGATNEIGLFHMGDKGLAEVDNPSELFLSEQSGDVPGLAVFAGMEGSRPVLVEIQTLVASTSLGTPRRAVVGWDASRLAMILAVLDARCGLNLGQHDVYLNVAGGLRINEPAADLAVAASLVSSALNRPLPQNTVVFGEISLSGAIRLVAQPEARLREAERLGFERAIVPSTSETRRPSSQLECIKLGDLNELVAKIREI